MKIKKFISLLAATTMIVTAVTGSMTVSVVSAADKYATSGKCGASADWLINTDGVLVISGTGEISTYADNSRYSWNWYTFKDDINEVVIENGITALYNGVFSSVNCSDFSKIILPPSLTKFNECFDRGVGDNYPNLKDIYVYSKNVLDASSLYDNHVSNPWAGSGKIWHVYKGSATETLLKNDLHLTDEDIKYIPDNEQMATVSNKTPAELEPLTDTSGPTGLTSKWEWEASSKTLTFSGKGPILIADDYKKSANTAEHVIIESGITKINPLCIGDSGSFTGFTALKDIKLPNTLKEIGNYSFYQTPITKIINGLPEGLEVIGDGAFSDSNLEEISFPESLNTIGESAFLGTNIKSINLHSGMYIGGSAFYNCQSLKEVTVPENVSFGSTKKGGQGAPRASSTFFNCTELERIVIEDGCKITDSWANVVQENAIVESFCKNCTSLKTVVIRGGIDCIMLTAFDSCTSLDDIYFYIKELSSIEAKGASTASIDTTNNPTFHVVKGSTTEQTLKDAGYLNDENTVYLADTTALETAISEAEAIETDKYTDESVAKFTEALESAKATLENYDATQDEVDSAVKAIEDAKNALADKSGEPSTDNSSDPSNSSGNNNQSQSPNTPATPSTSAPTTATPKQPTTPPTVTTTAKPAKVKAVKVKAKKKKLNVSWKKVSGATGYEVLSATNNKFTKGKKTVTVKKNKVTLKKLKPKKKYFVKVRAYKLANGRKYFGKWSKVVKKKTK